MWKPTMVAAEAFSGDRFAVAFGELDYDDPFTAVLDYDGASPQPWSRTDIEREIEAIAPVGPGEPGRFAAASDEGDVYFIGDATVREKIPGAGIASPDAAKIGLILALSRVGGRLLAAGQGAQLCRRTAVGRWDRISTGALAGIGRKLVGFTAIRAASEGDVYLLGVASPRMSVPDPAEQRALEGASWDAIFAAHGFNDPHTIQVDEGRIHHFDGAAWRQLDLPGPDVIKDAFIERPDRVWLVGTGGTILVGDPADGFRRVDVGGATETFLSFTR